MSDIILTQDKKAFGSLAAAKAAQTRYKSAGINTVIESAGEDDFILRKVELPVEIHDPHDKQNNEEISKPESQPDSVAPSLSERRPDRVEREQKRIPLGSQGPLYIAKKYKNPNYKERVVNDKPGRVDAFQNAGWEMVCVIGENQIVGDPHCGKAGKVGTPVRIHTGGGEYGYLMRIKREWYDEDQNVKIKRNKETEIGLTRQEEVEGRYGKVEIIT